MSTDYPSSSMVNRSSPVAATVSPQDRIVSEGVVTSTHVAPASTPEPNSPSNKPPHRALIFFFTWKIDQWIATVILYLIPFIIGYVVPPACRFFYLEDYDINFPYTEHEMFPTYSLVFVVLLPIILIYFPCIYLFGGTSKYWQRELNAWVLVQLMATGMALAMINTTKVMGGRLRPDFVARLRREGLVSNVEPLYPPVFNAGFSYESVCENKWRQDNNVLRDGHLSFPSGHAGTGFSAMIPLCFFLIARLRPFYFESLWRLVVSFLPLVLAWVIALSRTMDYRHNYADIVAGGLIGVISGGILVLVHFRYITSVGVWALKIPKYEYDAYVVAVKEKERQLAREYHKNQSVSGAQQQRGISPSINGQHRTLSPIQREDQRIAGSGGVPLVGATAIDIPTSPHHPNNVAPFSSSTTQRGTTSEPMTQRPQNPPPNFSLAENSATYNSTLRSLGSTVLDDDHHSNFFTTDRSSHHSFRGRGFWHAHQHSEKNAESVGNRDGRSSSQLGLLRPRSD